MAVTTHLGVTLVEQSQAQKEVTVNQALMRIDAVLNTGAISQATNTPPESPSTGDLYIVGNSPIDEWTGKAKQLAYYDQLWRFIEPNEGMSLWVNDEDVFYHYDGSSWIAAASGGGGGGGGGTITLSGDVTGSGTSSIVTSIGAGKVTNSMLAGGIDLTTKVTGVLPITRGGTGQTNSNDALSVLLPSQGGNSGKYLTTNGSAVSWATVAGGGGGGDGIVLQLLSTTKTDTFSTTGTGFADVTGLSCTITPTSASSKIMVTVTLMLGGPAGTDAIIAQIVRNSTAVGVGAVSGSRTSACATTVSQNAAFGSSIAFSFLDAPATTSATTYKIQIRSSSAGTIYVNRTATDMNADGFVRGASTITVQEISA